MVFMFKKKAPVIVTDNRDPVTFVCWKWHPTIDGKKGVSFVSNHVNILAASIKRNMQDPYEFICITDDPAGINPGIKTIPLWPDYNDSRGCFRRLKIFSPEMEQLIGKRIVSIDLDCVIISDITPLFRRDEEFIIWGEHTRRAPYCGSFWMMKAGTRPYIWNDFSFNAFPKRYHKLGTDQGWLNYKMYPREAMWTSEDGIYNFNRYFKARHLISVDPDGHKVVRSKRANNKPLPKNARIMFFNGRSDPSVTDLQTRFPWILEHWHE